MRERERKMRESDIIVRNEGNIQIRGWDNES